MNIDIAFDFRTFFRALSLYFTRYPLTPRRIIIIGLFLALYPPIVLIVRLGQFLDGFLFPACKTQKLHQPLHIMGNPRSGTTFMHNLVSLDINHFRSLTLYDILFPSICIRKSISVIGRLDSWFGGLGHGILKRLDARIFNGLRDIHPTSFHAIEEDALVLCHTFLSPMMYLLFPFREEIPFLGMLDSLPLDIRQKHLEFYRKCLKNHLALVGPDKRLLSKNVTFTGSIKSLTEVFPDIKIVFLVRNPYEAIPSLQSMVYAYSRLLAPGTAKDSPEMKSAGEAVCQGYLQAHKAFREIPPGQIKVVRYDDFINSPRQTIEDLYAWIGLEMDSTFVGKLQQKLKESQKYKSEHHYDFEDFGLDRATIHQQLREILETYGWGTERLDAKAGAIQDNGETGLKVPL